MIQAEEVPSDSLGSDPGGRDGSELRREGDRAWRRDVALEMWIDASTRPVSIRLAGVLDGATGANLVHVVDDCLEQGMREFALDTGSLLIEGSGRRVVEQVAGRVRDVGGSLQLDLALR